MKEWIVSSIFFFFIVTEATHDTGDEPCEIIHVSPNHVGAQNVQFYEIFAENLTCPSVLTSANANMYDSDPDTTDDFSSYSFSVVKVGGNFTVSLMEPAGQYNWSFYLSFECPENCWWFLLQWKRTHGSNVH